jgi:hypothetical protein
MLVAFGFHQLARFAGRYLPPGFKAVISGLLLLLVVNQVVTVYAHYGASPKEDWRAVGDLLQANAHTRDAVIAVNAEPAVNWYYPAGRQPADTFKRSSMLWTTVRRKPRRWFVLSSYSRDQDQEIRQWLEREGAVKLAIDRRITVYFHQEGKTHRELLEHVLEFSLPQSELTLQVLAEQFEQAGELEVSRRLTQFNAR